MIDKRDKISDSILSLLYCIDKNVLSGSSIKIFYKYIDIGCTL